MQYFYRIVDAERNWVGKKTTTAEAAVVKGVRITAGLISKERGSGSQPHRHPKVEQFNYVLKGQFKAMVEGEHKLMEPGDMVHIPPNALHHMVAVGEGENIYFMAKDAHADPELWILGKNEDQTLDKPYFEPGFEKEDAK
ncbi:MAG: cupin domain-containing protein [Rhodospirillales bacterium]